MTKAVWKLNNESYEFIKGEIAFIFKRYDIRCIPVSGFEIAFKMRIQLIPYSSLTADKLETVKKIDPDGFVMGKGEKDIIYYNDIDLPRERQNMTILHELAHIILDHTGLEKDREREEDEADFFAKYAIAPPVLVETLKLQSSEDICRYFFISREAAKYAFDYYHTWKQHYEKTKRYTRYERDILEQFYKNKAQNEEDLPYE